MTPCTRCHREPCVCVMTAEREAHLRAQLLDERPGLMAAEQACSGCGHALRTLADEAEK